MPKSVELRAAMALDGRPSSDFDMKDVLDGEWSNITAEASDGFDDESTGAEGSNNNENQAGAEASIQQDSSGTSSEPAAAETSNESAAAVGEASAEPTPAAKTTRRGRGSME